MDDSGLNMNKEILTTQVRCFSQLGVACLLLLLACVCYAAPDFPQLTGRIVDQANLLSEQQESRLTALLAQHEETTSNQIVIVTLESLQDYDIADYGHQLGRYWGIGQKQKNNGVLLLVAPKQRKVRIEVGYGLEGALTDILSQQIIQAEIIPHFRDGNFAEGIEAGTEAMLKAIAGEYRAKPQQTPSSSRSYVPDWDGINALFNFVVAIGITLGFLLTRKAISTASIGKILSAIIPMYFVIWVLSASLYHAAAVSWIFSLFYVTFWMAGAMSTMTLMLSVIANFVVFLCLYYLFDVSPGLAMFITLVIAVIVIFPVTHYKLPRFQNKYGEKLLPNSVFWCAVVAVNVTTFYLLHLLMTQLMLADFGSEKILLGLLLTPFVILIPTAIYAILTGKSRFRVRKTLSGNDHHSDYSSSGSSSSSSSSRSSSSSFSSGGGNFGGGGSSGSW